MTDTTFDARRAERDAKRPRTFLCADPNSPHNGHGVEIRQTAGEFAYCRCTRCDNPERFYIHRDRIIEQG